MGIPTGMVFAIVVFLIYIIFKVKESLKIIKNTGGGSKTAGFGAVPARTS